MARAAQLLCLLGLAFAVAEKACTEPGCSSRSSVLLQSKQEARRGLTAFENLHTVGSDSTGNCKPACAKDPKSWSRKCTKEHCSACAECASTTTTTAAPSCKPACHKDPKHWSRKCTHVHCSACAECATTTTPAPTTTTTPAPTTTTTTGGYVDCNWETEETCYEDKWGTWSPVGCELISEGGCPCKDGEHKCGGDEFYAGWCQLDPCPVHCDWQTEETCFDENWQAVSCFPIDEGGCPCPSPQVKCGAHDGYAGYCQDAPCPLTCDWETEFTCYDENWMAVSCAHKTNSSGCPCPGEEVRCGSDEHYEGWCQAAPCPVTCNWMIEETCYDDNWNAVSCSLISEGGCPCKEGQNKCGAMEEPHPYAGYCQDGACPLTCDWMTEETCYDDNWVAVSCANISDGGCPCKAGQQKCGSFPEDNIVGWCSDMECPLTCNWMKEEYCYDENWQLTGCATISDGGCPCSSGQEKCGAYPADNIAGWCQEGPCPFTCNWKIEETCYDDYWSPVSCANISDGGCPCPEGQSKCGAYDAGTYGPNSEAYAGFCTDQCWDSYLQQAKREHASELVLLVRGQYHVFDLGGKEKRALRKELKQLKLNHAVQLHTGHLNMTLSSFLATQTGAVEFASLAGNHSRASSLLTSLRPHLHTGAVLQFRDLMQPKEKKHLNQLFETNHKAGLHMAPVKDDGNELLFRITGTK